MKRDDGPPTPRHTPQAMRLVGNREELDAHLDQLSPAELERVLSFVRMMRRPK